jgi:hypothetical protein
LFDGESGEAGEVLGAAVPSLQELRPSARVHPAVSDLPDLLPGTGEPGENSRRCEGELVKT